MAAVSVAEAAMAVAQRVEEQKAASRAEGNQEAMWEVPLESAAQ